MSTSQETKPPDPPPAPDAREPAPAGPRRLRRALGRAPRAATLPPQGSLRWSFTWAFEGIVYVLRTQRNMQIHAAAAVVALVMGLLLDFSRLEFAALIGAISLVLVAEMLNTALEAAVDAVVTSYHPLVKIAKDVAAGAVLVATVNALAIAYFVFYEKLTDPGRDLLAGVRRAPIHVVVVTMIVTLIIVVAVKAWVGRGTPLRGGLPSGHAAAAFAAWAAVTIIAEPLRHAALVSTLAFLMALLVAQSRVEAGIHSIIEVAAGAVLGTGVAIIMFQLLG